MLLPRITNTGKLVSESEVVRIALHHHAAESDQLLASKLFSAIQKTDALIKKVTADTERGYALIRKHPL